MVHGIWGTTRKGGQWAESMLIGREGVFAIQGCRITRWPAARCVRECWTRIGDDEAGDGRPQSEGSPEAIGRHNLCHQRDPRFSRYFAVQLDGRSGCHEASVPGSERQWRHMSRYRRGRR